jgi:hypothetical protein
MMAGQGVECPLWIGSVVSVELLNIGYASALPELEEEKDSDI